MNPASHFPDPTSGRSSENDRRRMLQSVYLVMIRAYLRRKQGRPARPADSGEVNHA